MGVSCFVLGFALKPLVWAPLSEIFRRQRLFIITFIALTVFNAAATALQNMQTLRSLAGAFGSSPLANARGIIADMFDADEKGVVGALFAAAQFIRPTIVQSCSLFYVKGGPSYLSILG